ncbi:MAG: protein-L-isoaspartate(D-aspartate) O-methyltransferase [Campylobacterales bacterium]|nr:protein-L-isoaspartate(D-aspartate) O-methyltransferase [Campylobacterales bacterium]
MNSIQQSKNRKLAQDINKVFSLSPELIEAFSNIDRESFVTSSLKHLAYKLDALPITGSQWISSPLTVAKMSHYLECKSADKVLEIGCGSGYQAAILSKLIRRVFTIERIEKLLNEARVRFKELGLSNIHTRLDDGQKGWREFAKYDRILFSASILKIPDEIFEQLDTNGILIAPIVVGNKQIITRYTKKSDKIVQENIEECKFIEVKDGVIRG